MSDGLKEFKKKIEDAMEEFGVYPQSYSRKGKKRKTHSLLCKSSNMFKGKGWTKTKDGGVRNAYGEGWNDAVMKVHERIYGILEDE